MNFIALKMLTGDRAKYLGLIFTIAFCTFLLENQTSIFAGILKRTGSQIKDVTDAEIGCERRRVSARHCSNR
jgi:putative ABC transport system permease protein